MRACTLALASLLLSAAASAQTVAPYRVVAEERTDAQRTVDVRIERRIEEGDVDAIANLIVNREAKPYMRTVVNFLLSNARAGEPPWASATLQRELKVRIPGLKLDEERLFTAEAHADKRIVIGAWLTSTPATPGRLTIFREGRQMFAEWRLRGGLRSRDELTETRVSAGRRFDVRNSTGDDHYIMTAGGELEIRAQSRLIAVAEPIKPAGADQTVATATRPRTTVVEPFPAAASLGAGSQPVATAAPGSTLAAVGTEAETPAAAKSVTAKAPARAVQRKPEKPAQAPVDLTRFLQPSG